MDVYVKNAVPGQHGGRAGNYDEKGTSGFCLSVYFVVGSDSLKQDSFFAFVFNETENDPQIISRAASQGTLEAADKFVGF
jgi:hypothetical protein